MNILLKLIVWLALTLYSMTSGLTHKDTVTSKSQTSSQDCSLGSMGSPQFRHRNCRGIMEHGFTTNGVYIIYPYDCCPERPVKVYCDLETDAGGWTVIQRRDDFLPRENFKRSWMEYILGFGNIRREFWLGLDHIHALTTQHLTEIRFDLEDFEGESRFAKYNFFFVHDRSQDYQLEVEGYSGDAGDSFSAHNLQKFSTKDKDLDNDGQNCAVIYKGAWWYNACHQSNLNGFYYGGVHTTYADGTNWYGWKGYNYSLKFTEMKIRPFY